MRARILLRRALIGLVASIALLVAFGTLLGLALDAGYFKEPFIRFVSAGIGRQILVQGPLHAHVFSFHPQFSAEGVEIGNPAWMPAGLTAKIGNLSLVLTVPHIGASGNFGLETLDAAAAFFYLARDAAGRANWQWTDPALGRHKTAAIVRSLRIPNARVVLDDVPRHLHFDGTVSAQQANTADKQEPLRIEGVGQMNGRETSIDITADSLVTAAHERPFHFSFAERSSGSRLTGRGFLPLPFDFSVLETTFDAAGANLKDLFFLTGVTLINTGAYHLHGQLIRQGSILKFSDLVATSKSSDVHGELSIDVSNSRPQFAANL